MPHRVIRVTTASRLHFGLFSIGPFGPGEPASAGETAGSDVAADAGQGDAGPVRRFGGIGAMIARPGIKLTVTDAQKLEAVGPLAARAAQFARQVGAAIGLKREPACRIDVDSQSREHIGLGTGTQLGLAVALAIQALYGRIPGLPEQQARCVGRGERSAIGIFGFAMGGLLVEPGKRRAEEISPLVARVDLPSAWRFLLLMPKTGVGIHGEEERRAFTQLPVVPRATTDALAREALLNLLPAAVEGDFKGFSRSLFRFGHTAGNCFAMTQHGAFHSPRAAELIAQLQRLGIEGVGQSSWGPTLFALLPDEAAAANVAAQFQDRANLTDYDCLVTPPDNQGAQLEVESLD
jgi:beta-ribofuranosylaminobenzene 5'-phosphate synthase